MTQSPRATTRFHLPVWVAVCGFLAIAVFLLWEEHEAHILGATPYLLLLACPLIHLFMHRGHRHGSHGGHEHLSSADRKRADRHEQGDSP